MPPPKRAELPERVLFVTVSVPKLLSMPPPLPPLLFPLSVLPVTVTVPAFSSAPPKLLALLPLRCCSSR